MFILQFLILTCFGDLAHMIQFQFLERDLNLWWVIWVKEFDLPPEAVERKVILSKLIQ